MHYRHLLARLDSMLGHERLFVLLIPVSLLLLLPQPSNAFDSEHAGLVQISNRNITAFNNRNLTIECHVDLRNRSSAAASSHMEAPSFTTNGRIVLTFMTIPRQRMALHQMQSFLHCSDPDRTRCWAEFNMDPACLEDQMNYTYYHNQASYVVETACQVDDVNVCSSRWMAQFPLDCYDLGQINVINAPKLNQKCLYMDMYTNETMECGEKQYCNREYGICLCEKGYYPSNRRCIPVDPESELALTEVARTSTFTAATEPPAQTEDGSVVVRADSKGTFKAIVIFLLVVAIILAITLGIVIIWSRHYRHLIDEVSR